MNRSLWKLASLVWVALAMAGGLDLSACGSDPVVGGSCRTGYVECNHKCIDVTTDAVNCGVCGNVCAADLVCYSGVCLTQQEADRRKDAGVDVASPDSSVGGFAGAEYGRDARIDAQDSSEDGDLEAAGEEGGAPNEGGSGAGAGGIGGSGTGGDSDAAVSEDARDADASDADASSCAPPYNTREHCGDCATSCDDPSLKCGLSSGRYACIATCEAPLVDCSGECVDTTSDELNCGSCGHVCPALLCVASKCVGVGFGHVVVLGMDYSDASLVAGSAQLRLLTNSVRLTSTSPRVLAYTQFADAATVGRVKTWLGLTMTSAGTWEQLPSALDITSYDVLVIFDQPSAADSPSLATIGSFWHDPLASFVKAGGVVVALDGGTGQGLDSGTSRPGMGDFLTESGLLEVTGETALAGQRLVVAAPGDAVGVNVASPLAAKRNTVGFTTPLVADARHTIVVQDESLTLPVVVHIVQ